LAYAAMALMAAVGFAVAIVAYAMRGGRATL
jgi:hypothetical protein